MRRCPGPTTREILLTDAAPPPAHLTVEHTVDLGTTDVAFDEFVSTARAAAEADAVWGRTWQWACRDEHLPEAGDYVVYDVAHHSAIVIRQPDGGVRAFVNACLHRGTQLKPPGSEGWATQLRCPFHGWTWDTEGNIADVPCEWDFAHLTERDLPEIAVAHWGGFWFVNFAEDPDSFEEYIAPLADHFTTWDLAERYVEVHARKRLPANWKAAAGAFLEAYHILETHSQAVSIAGDANTQYDILGPHVSRFVQTLGYPSPHLSDDDRPSDRDIYARLVHGIEGAPELTVGDRPRDAAAAVVRRRLEETYDVDLSGYSTSETLDSIEYYLFPGSFFFPGLDVPLCYRFRPGPTPDESVFDVLFLRPRPRSGHPPPPARPFDLDIDDSYTTVPGMPEGLGHVFDQDTANLAAQTRGFKASRKGGQTLGRYQEVRVRHLHQNVHRYLDRD